MSKRLDILKSSLDKKQSAFDASLDAHITDVKSANGQPLNDKRDGHITLNRWERQNLALRSKQEGIEKTKNAIEREEGKIYECEAALAKMPPQIADLVKSGVLIQWRKHPTVFFVEGVDKARIQFKGGNLVHRYVGQITDKGQYSIFRDVFNNLKASLSGGRPNDL